MSVEISKCYFAVKILTLSYPENTVVQVRTLKRMKRERIEAKKQYKDDEKNVEKEEEVGRERGDGKEE
jgi:hypothetical protein